MRTVRRESRWNMDPFICREFYHAHVKGMSTPEEQHADQDEGGENNIPDKVHPMDALTATEPGVFVIGNKTILALHITNQPQQKLSAETNLISQECMEFLDFLRVAGRIVRDTATKVVD